MPSRLNPARAAIVVLIALVLAAPGPAQGAGLVGSNGFEPRVWIEGVRAGLPSVLHVERLVPQGGAASLLIGISSKPGTLDLTPLGAAGGILGIELDPLIATTLVLPEMVVPASGELVLPFLLPVTAAGSTWYVQVANLDPGAPAGGLALSDALAVTFGAVEAHGLALTGPTLTQQGLVHLFADGAVSGPLWPATSGIELLDVRLTATHDTLALRSDVPVREASEATRPRLRFPTGYALYHYRAGSQRAGFFLVGDHGRRYVPLLEAPFMQGATPFEPYVGASAFEPLAAIVADEPIAAFGGASLFLVRTDGENHPGTASPVMPIHFTGPLAGFEPKEESLTFLQGALFLTDEQILVRVPTDLQGQPEQVVLPPSGGLVPDEVDQELAWSADGSTVAFGAGQDEEHRDIYVARATGPAVNVTQNAGEYENVSYGDLLDGGRLALAPDGSRVAYVLREGSKELFVQDTQPGTPRLQLTGPNLFESTIDQEVGILFSARTTLNFNAGRTGTDHDAYGVALPPAATGPVGVTNVTGSSGVTAPPFTYGTMSGVHLAGLPGQHALSVLRNVGAPQQPLQILHIRASGTQVVDASATNVVAAQPLPGLGLLAFESGGTSRVVGFVATGTQVPVYTAPPGSQVLALVSGAQSTMALAIVGSGANQQVVLLPPAGAPAMVSNLQAASLSCAAGFLEDGTILLVSSPQGPTIQLYRIDPATGTAAPLGPLAGPTHLL